MKCKYCGAEIKEGSNVCEYCDSEVERDREIPEPQTIIIENNGSSKGTVVKTIGKVIIALACVWAVVIVLFLVILLNSDTFKNIDKYSTGIDTAYDIPVNETGLIGYIVNCDTKGVASVEYENHTYENVKILDKELMEWLNETGKKIDGVKICFATDGKGDISEIGLSSADFFVMAKEGTRYTAIRDGAVITFTSANPIETDCCYSGYFSYPDMHLCWGEEISILSLSYMDPKCEDKEEAVWQQHYTGEDITVYRILVEGKWYCCSRETYDAIQVGDLLNEYELCEEQELAFIVRK